MGQTIRQSMSFNAHYAFMQSGVRERLGQQPRGYASISPTYSSTIGVWFGTYNHQKAGSENIYVAHR